MNSPLDRVLDDAYRLRATFVGCGGYALAYGSHARRTNSSGSDLDLLFVGPVLAAGRLDDLVRAVVDLHQAHGLRLDREVAYEVKLHAAPGQVAEATALRGFTVSRTGDVDVPDVVAEPWFLNSTPFKLRLVLNSLTTPHLFLGGDSHLYQRQRHAAERAVALLALSLLPPAEAFNIEDAAGVLVTAPEGSTGRDYLGYCHDGTLRHLLEQAFISLGQERAVRPVDGDRFEQRPDARRRLVVDLPFATTPVLGMACP